MLKSRRIAVLPLDIPGLEDELRLIDAEATLSEYDAFTFGTWVSYVLSNGSGAQDDTAFRPHAGELTTTGLGDRLPGIMAFVRRHFTTDALQWVRIFGLQDGILAPHRDFLEFDEPGVRLQIPLRTTEMSLHSENSVVYHLRAGEVWQIHTVDPHSAYSGPGQARLSLCLDFAGEGFDPDRHIHHAIPATDDIRIVQRPRISDDEITQLIESSSPLTRESARSVFRALAVTHFERESNAVDVFTWFERAAARSGSEELVDLARRFRVFCLDKRAWREDFIW